MGYSNIPDEAEERKKASKEIRDSLHRCQKFKFPKPETLFDDVYDELPVHLREQKEELKEHLEKYGDKYEFMEKF